MVPEWRGGRSPPPVGVLHGWAGRGGAQEAVVEAVWASLAALASPCLAVYLFRSLSLSPSPPSPVCVSLSSCTVTPIVTVW